MLRPIPITSAWDLLDLHDITTNRTFPVYIHHLCIEASHKYGRNMENSASSAPGTWVQCQWDALFLAQRSQSTTCMPTMTLGGVTTLGVTGRGGRTAYHNRTLRKQQCSMR